LEAQAQKAEEMIATYRKLGVNDGQTARIKRLQVLKERE
jgi:hypothetical protein